MLYAVTKFLVCEQHAKHYRDGVEFVPANGAAGTCSFCDRHKMRLRMKRINDAVVSFVMIGYSREEAEDMVADMMDRKGS